MMKGTGLITSLDISAFVFQDLLAAERTSWARRVTARDPSGAHIVSYMQVHAGILIIE